jgi:hypothetical protein
MRPSSNLKENMSFDISQVIALVILFGVLAFGLARLKKPAAFVTVETKVETKVEDYAEAELVKLATLAFGRLSDHSADLQTIADAQAAMAHRDALLTKLQGIAAAAKPTTVV